MLWNELLADLRADMKDPQGTRLDADTALLYLKFALRDYSEWNPLVQTTTLDLDSLGMADLPDDWLRTYVVRDPDGNEIKEFWGDSNPPTTLVLTGQTKYWWREGGSIRLTSWADVPDTITFLYGAYHTWPATATATGFSLSFPDKDEEAILLYIRWKAAGSVRTKTAYLDRYKTNITAGNTRRDNPLTPEANTLYDEYYRIMATRYGNTGPIRLEKT